MGEGLGSVADADEFAIPLAVLLLAAGSARDTLHLNFVDPVNDALPPTDPVERNERRFGLA